jgi:hypothetical protein
MNALLGSVVQIPENHSPAHLTELLLYFVHRLCGGCGRAGARWRFVLLGLAHDYVQSVGSPSCFALQVDHVQLSLGERPWIPDDVQV